MQPAIEYDIEGFIRQLRELRAELMAEVRRSVTDPDTLAGFEAQFALDPAVENWTSVHMQLRGAGRSPNFLAALVGNLMGRLLLDLLMNCAEPDIVMEIAMRNLHNVAAGNEAYAGRTFHVTGTVVGRA